MWDVIWTDPDRELVGEHRAKKDKKKDPDDPAAKRNSISTRSSLSSTDSPFGFLRSRGIRHLSSSGGSGTAAKTKSSTSSGLASPVTVSTSSPLAPTLDVRSRRSSSLVISRVSDMQCDMSRTTQGSSVTDKTLESSNGEVSPSISCHDSVFSTREPDIDALTANSVPDAVLSEPGKPASLVQSLGSSSFVTKRTEVATSPRLNDSVDFKQATTKTLITSNPKSNDFSESTQAINDSPLLSASWPESAVPVPPARSPLRTASKRSSLTPKGQDAETWRPPDEWECVPSGKQIPTARTSGEAVPSSTLQNEVSISIQDTSPLRKNVERMKAAGPDIVLSRLKEVWNTTPNTKLHDEVEAERKRWMLSTLHHLDLVRDPEPSQESMISPDKVQKLLALYESQSTTSYVAALYNQAQVYHMSATPCSPEQVPNVHPVMVPCISTTSFPVAAGLFDLVCCLSLPSLCPSPDIVGILRNIHHCLQPGGVLRITLVDPLPCAHTLGRHLRRWLDDNLVVNLEEAHRCAHPTRLFSRWLGQASLRGPGSAVMAAKFFAMPQSVSLDRRVDPDAGAEAVRALRETKAELRALVGRMLWCEVWGRFVTADKMWWDDPVCVKECLDMGTFWQYHIIEAVKEAAPSSTPSCS